MVGFEVIDLIAELFYSVIGSPLLMGLVLVGLFTMALLMFKAPAVAILGIIIPLVIGFVLNAQTSNFLEVPAWIIITLFIMASFLFAGFFLFFTR